MTTPIKINRILTVINDFTKKENRIKLITQMFHSKMGSNPEQIIEINPTKYRILFHEWMVLEWTGKDWYLNTVTGK